MIINPIALATKGYVGNNLNITMAFKGDIDLSGVTQIHPTGGVPLFLLQEEEDIMMVINAFLFMKDTQ